jgi:hypothetical protein
MSTTPRTDEATYPADCLGKTLVVNRNCAAALKTELAAMQVRAEKAEAELAKRDSEYLRGTAMVAESASVWQSRAEKAEFDLVHSRVMVRILRDALENLRDEQNGAPLCTREEKWKQAMDRADAALAQKKEASK